MINYSLYEYIRENRLEIVTTLNSGDRKYNIGIRDNGICVLYYIEKLDDRFNQPVKVSEINRDSEVINFIDDLTLVQLLRDYRLMLLGI
jgi:hypothetical protein